MDALLRDIRLGLRTLRRSPALTAVAVLALTCGIGLTTMMFSIVYGALLRGLPYEDGDRIAVVERGNPERNIDRQSLPVHDFADMRAAQRSFSALHAYTSGTMNVSGTDKAERFSGSWVTAGLLDVPGVPPLLGRTFREGEDGPAAARVVVLGYAMWRDRYGSDAGIVGRTIRINGEPYEIVGVMPEGFRFPVNDQLWVPFALDPAATPRGNGPFVQVVGRLAPGVTVDAANAELATLAARLAAEHPEHNAGFTAFTRSFVQAFIGDEPTQLLYTMLGAVFFVLLIACANVANLLLDRAAHRSKEVGVRAALGASRSAIVRVFLTEAFVLAVGGTIGGLVVAKVGMDLFTRAIVDTDPPYFIQIGLYPPVLAFTAGVALLATLLAGLIPAWQASRTDLAEVLKDESRGASSLKLGRLSRALVVFEVALSVGLLVAAGLMIKSVVKAGTRDTGFASETVFTARVGFPANYTDTAVHRQFFEQIAERVRMLPGVEAATVAAGLPGAEAGFDGDGVTVEGRQYASGADVPDTRIARVDPGFFATLDIPLRAGRLFDASDRDGGVPVAVVNERFVRQMFPDGDAIGKRVRLGGLDSDAPHLTIVGVVPDLFAGNPDDPRPPIVFRPLAQAGVRFAYIAARTNGAPMALAQPVREAVASLNPDLPLYWVQPLDEAIAGQLWFVRVFGSMFAIFGVVALFLASIGLYAVMSFSVSRRTREMGIRMALGSPPARIVRLVATAGAWQLGVGMVLGLGIAAGASRLLSVVLFDVQPLDPVVFALVALTLGVTGTVACLLPARRATRVDPSVAMRAE